VFVEVKARRSRRFGVPEEAVDARKQERLVRGARAWLAAHRHRGRARFDVIILEPDPEADPAAELRLRHIENAFETG
jgi:putative endonuclease